MLDYVVTSYLYTTYPELKPGHLTDLRSMSVSNLSFADVAGRLSMHKFVICDSSALRESMSKFVNEIGDFSSEAEDIEERTYPKVSFLHSCTNLLYPALVIYNINFTFLKEKTINSLGANFEIVMLDLLLLK